MKFCEIVWPDSDIENINIEYNCAILTIWNYALKKKLFVKCSGFAGITNLCIFDDTTIVNAKVFSADEKNDPFVINLCTAYDKSYDYGGRILSDGVLELRIELTNRICFSLYCQEIEVLEYNPIQT